MLQPYKERQLIKLHERSEVFHVERWIPGLEKKQHIGSKSTYTKNELIQKLKDVKKKGWIVLTKYRQFKDGGLGNTLEDLLGVPENNIPLADYGVFELKTHRSTSNSLISLFRFEPKPGKVIPNLVENYGWPLPKYGPKERSLRVDITAANYAERGFIVEIDEEAKRVEIHFNQNMVPKKQRYITWLQNVEKRVGLGDLKPVPFWTFDDLEKKVQLKIKNMVYVTADTSRKTGRQLMKISKAILLQGSNLSNLLDGLKKGWFKIEFSARTGHNHGTAFRTFARNWPKLYSNMEVLL